MWIHAAHGLAGPGRISAPQLTASPLRSPQGLIVQQRVSGMPFTDVLRACATGDAKLQEKACGAVMELLRAYGHMMLVDGLFHADPHPGNFFLKVGVLSGAACSAHCLLDTCFMQT